MQKHQGSDSVSGNEFFNSIEKLRQKLLDLTGRNNSISFKHSNRVKKQIRFIDEVPEKIFDRLLAEQSFEIIGIPVPNLEPEDEKTDEFKKKLSDRKKKDEKYKKSLEELGPNPSKRKIQTLDNELRNQIRLELNMPPVDRSKRPPLPFAAEKHGLDPSYDLVRQSNNKKHKDKYIQTLFYQDELEIVLDGIIEQKKLVESETGTEPLYIALGFLEWYESESSDKALHSPLVFLPVALEREKDEETNKYKYLVKLRETEAYYNFSLKERFARDFKISIPEIEYTDDEGTHYLRLNEYYQKIENLIKNKKDWSIKNWATMSFFSFTKLAMYQELEKSKLTQICNDATPLQELIYGAESNDGLVAFAQDYNIEHPDFKRKTPHLISIADTSQISAIIDAVDSKNLVIEGPPGTGKSQTITNMIAALVDSGKSVLFVAEKRAALTVVKDRLSQAGLGPFCLELHSGKSKKTEVLKSLSERFEAKSKRNPNNLNTLLENVDELKTKISNYLDFLHETYEPLGVSLQEVMWTLLNIKYKNQELDALIASCEINDVNELSKWDIQKIELALSSLSTEYQAHIEKYGFVESHPWYGFIDTEILAIDIPNYLKDLSQIRDNLSSLEVVGSKLSLNVGNQASITNLASLCNSFENFKEHSRIDITWAKNLIKIYKKDLGSIIEDLLNVLQVKRATISDLKTILNKEMAYEKALKDTGDLFLKLIKNQFSTLSVAELKEILKSAEKKRVELADNTTATKASLVQKSNSEKSVIENYYENELKSGLDKYEKLENTTKDALAYYNEICKIAGFNEKLTVQNFNKISSLKGILAKCPIDKWNLKNDSMLDFEVRTVLKKVVEDGKKLQDSHDRLKQIVDLKTDRSSHELRRSANQIKSSNVFSWIFNSEYRNASKLADQLLSAKVSKAESAKILFETADFFDTREKFNGYLSRTSGLDFLRNLDLSSDFDGLTSWCEFYDLLSSWSNDYVFSENSVRNLLSLDISKLSHLKNKIIECKELNYLTFSEYIPSEVYDLEIIINEVDQKRKLFISTQENKKNTLVAEKVEKLSADLKELESKYSTEDNKLSLNISNINECLSEAAELGIIENISFNRLENAAEYLKDIISYSKKLSQGSFLQILQDAPNIEELKSSGQVDNLNVIFEITTLFDLTDSEVSALLELKFENWLKEKADLISKASECLLTIKSLADRSDFGSLRPYNLQLKDLVVRLNHALANENTISGYIEYSRSYEAIGSYSRNLNNLISVAVKKGEVLRSLAVAFKISYYTSVIKNYTKQRPAYFKSVSNVFNEYREKFRKIDNDISEAYRIDLQNKLLKREAPPGIARGKKSEYSECGLLEYQIKLKRPNVPVRSLMQRASQSIQTLKPIFLMSPLSVAQLLPEKHIQFDVVIMDEASQMRPEDSLGSIARAKQVIIVGDPKQMPPSDFFSRSSDGSTDAEEEDYIDVKEESVLDLGLNIFKPARRLKWHYRSRSEKLIAFSNRHFYDGDLIIFPSAYNSNAPMGVKYEKVESVYNKGTNQVEARAAIDKAISLIHQFPDKSMMVVAMNKAQSELIQEILSELEKNDPILEAYRAKFESTLEPFLIRNLENVQGDERDIVIISTVYGPDANGQVFQRFGPINSEYGHRRLNVLFTRAKYFMCVVSSLDPDKILVTNSSTQGVIAFKNFLSYAKTGRLGDEVTSAGDREPDSDFEIFVAKRLQEKMPNLKIVPQVGVAGFYIDIGIRHPEKEGAFLLGIECDGKAYHSAKSARDRDKIRQKVLEDLGWNLYRIWSTDWFNNPDYEIKKLVERINYLLSAS